MWQPPPSPRISESPVIKSQGPSIERLQQLSQLASTRIFVSDVLVGEGKGCRGLWLVRGDAIVAVDLRKAAVVEKDENAKRATIQLPQPEVLQARVDCEQTRIFELKSTSWLPWTSDKDALRDAVYDHAQRLIDHAAGSADNIQQAKASAESVIRSFFAELAWTVSVTWAKPPSNESTLATPAQ